MIRKTLLVVACLLAVLTTAGSVLYVRNATPVEPSITTTEATNADKPFVVKLHAQWCPVCMFTEGTWQQVETKYSGRVNFVVFDFTNQATTNAGKAEAKRLGLEKFFSENEGDTGSVAVLDPRTKEETASIHGSRNLDDYRTVIDASLHSLAR